MVSGAIVCCLVITLFTSTTSTTQFLQSETFSTEDLTMDSLTPGMFFYVFIKKVNLF